MFSSLPHVISCFCFFSFLFLFPFSFLRSGGLPDHSRARAWRPLTGWWEPAPGCPGCSVAPVVVLGAAVFWSPQLQAALVTSTATIRHSHREFIHHPTTPEHQRWTSRARLFFFRFPSAHHGPPDARLRARTQTDARPRPQRGRARTQMQRRRPFMGTT